MRLGGILLILCVALAALQVAARALALMVVGAIVCSAIVQPKQTLGWLAGLLCLSLVGQYPLPAMLVMGALVLVGKLAPPRSNP